MQDFKVFLPGCGIAGYLKECCQLVEQRAQRLAGRPVDDLTRRTSENLIGWDNADDALVGCTAGHCKLAAVLMVQPQRELRLIDIDQFHRDNLPCPGAVHARTMSVNGPGCSLTPHVAAAKQSQRGAFPRRVPAYLTASAVCDTRTIQQ